MKATYDLTSPLARLHTAVAGAMTASDPFIRRKAVHDAIDEWHRSEWESAKAHVDALGEWGFRELLQGETVQ